MSNVKPNDNFQIHIQILFRVPFTLVFALLVYFNDHLSPLGFRSGAVTTLTSTKIYGVFTRATAYDVIIFQALERSFVPSHACARAWEWYWSHVSFVEGRCLTSFLLVRLWRCAQRLTPRSESVSYIRATPHTHTWAPGPYRKGALAPTPWNLTMMTSCAAILRNTSNFRTRLRRSQQTPLNAV